MKRNNVVSPVLFKKRVLFREVFMDFCIDYVGPSYNLSKNSFFLNKFNTQFFKLYLFFFKKMSFLIKNVFIRKVFKRYVSLEFKKFLFGNVSKRMGGYESSNLDRLFFFFKKKETSQMSRYFPPNLNTHIGFYSNCYYSTYSNFLKLPQSLESLEDYVYKCSIYDSYLNCLNSEEVSNLVVGFNFNPFVEFNFFFFIEVYKIHYLFVILKLNK